MSANEDSIQDTAREQLRTENQTDELKDVLGNLANSLLEDAKHANSVKQKRMAMEEIRKVRSELKEEEDRQKRISEYSVEELFDEFVQLIEEREKERGSGEAEGSA